MNEKKYFKKKAEAIQNMIWDWEFKRYINRIEKEKARQEYDNIKSRLSILEAQIKSEQEKPTLNKDEFKRLEDEKVRMEAGVKKQEENMQTKDDELDGLRQSNEYPEGVSGINDQLFALRELLQKTINYIKSI